MASLQYQWTLCPLNFTELASGFCDKPRFGGGEVEPICPGVPCPPTGCILSTCWSVRSVESFDWQWNFSRGFFEGLVLPDSSSFPWVYLFQITTHTHTHTQKQKQKQKQNKTKQNKTKLSLSSTMHLLFFRYQWVWWLQSSTQLFFTRLHTSSDASYLLSNRLSSKES